LSRRLEETFSYSLLSTFDFPLLSPLRLNFSFPVILSLASQSRFSVIEGSLFQLGTWNLKPENRSAGSLPAILSQPLNLERIAPEEKPLFHR